MITTAAAEHKDIINEKGVTVQTRFNPPPGFMRKPVYANSFAYYLRNLPLKPAGAMVKYYNGSEKGEAVYEAVVDGDQNSR